MTMGKMYDEYHEYRVDTQRWQKWPKALIMTHEWSTNGHDRRIEQRRYVPDNYAVQLEMENCRIKVNAEYQKKLADVELEEAHEIRHNIDRLRERVHEIAADRDRIKAENAKLRACLDDGCADCAIGMGKYADSLCDPIKAENEKLREIVEDWYPHMLKRVGPTALAQWGHIKTMVELGVDIYPLNNPEPSKSED